MVILHHYSLVLSGGKYISEHVFSVWKYNVHLHIYKYCAARWTT